MQITTPIIKTLNLGKTYSDGEKIRQVLRDINFEIQLGQTAVIWGPSGSGKSSLLHILGGLHPPSEGSLWVNGLEVNMLNKTELANYRQKIIGFVFQSFYLLPGMNALQNVAYPLQIAGVGKDERNEIAFTHLKRVGLQAIASQTPDKLSGGEKQRVAIARALVNDPKIILADEPTGNLDKKNGQEVIQLLEDLCEKEKTIIIVSHNPDHLQNANVTIKIEDGAIKELIHA